MNDQLSKRLDHLKRILAARANNPAFKVNTVAIAKEISRLEAKMEATDV